MPKWLDIARAELGVMETPGPGSNPRVIEYFAAAGHREIKNDDTAWCAAFANFCLEEAGVRGTMSLAARSFQRWGKKTKPVPGAIVVLPRGSGWQGHVEIVDKVEGEFFWAIGGNVKNSVRRTRRRTIDAIDFRWPATMGTSRTVAASAGGTVATGANILLEQAEAAKWLASDLQEYVTWAGYAAIALTVVCFVLAGYFKYRDIKEKG